MKPARKRALSEGVAAMLNEASELTGSLLAMLSDIEDDATQAENYDVVYRLAGAREIVRGIRDRLGRVLDGEQT